MPLVYSIDCNTASRLLLSCSPEIRFLNTWLKSKISDLCHLYKNVITAFLAEENELNVACHRENLVVSPSFIESA